MNRRFWLALVGQNFGNRYKLTKFFDCGTFGGVFEADEIVANQFLRKVAIKLMLVEEDDADLQAAQLRELKTVMNLSHPYLLTCFTWEQAEINGMNFFGW